MRTTGLLGGSFNPAHRAHLSISLRAMKDFGLDDFWWLVSPGNPLKQEKGMAALSDRVRSARLVTQRTPITVSAIEAQLGTRYTIDTLRLLVRRYPKRRFLWVMGADNLAQLHRWRDWRNIARLLPIAVFARPGYDDHALAAPAMGWLRRFVRRPDQIGNWTEWSTPALVILRYRPDPRSATAIRLADPLWHRRFEDRAFRDPLTRRLIG